MSENQIDTMSGWIKIKFRDLVFFQEGPGLVSALFQESGFPFLNIRCIENGKINKEACQYISSEIANSIYKHFQLEEDDLVVSTSGTLGKKAFVKKEDLPLLLNTSIIRFKPIDDTKLSLAFLNYLLEDYDFLYDLYSQSTGSAQVNVGPSHLKKLSIRIPESLTEQTKIATILSKVDEAINQTEQLIAKYNRIKTGLMQDLLTKGIDENGNIRSEEAHEFKDSPLGRIPVEWNVLPLIDLCETIVDCKNRTSPFVERSNFPVIRTSNIKDGRLVWEEMKYTDSKSYKIWTERAIPQENDVIITREAPLGQIVKIPKGITPVLGQRTMLFRLDKTKLLPDFLVNTILTEKMQLYLHSFSGGSTVHHLKVGDMKNILVAHPQSTVEQSSIEKAIETVENNISSLLEKAKKLQLLKTGLMQDLLSGKVRVTNLINQTD